jgi:hypothetical protein
MAEDELPLKPAEPRPRKQVTPAPAWVALAAPWLGLITLILSIVTFIVPGSRDPQGELMHARPYSTADIVLPVALYIAVAAIFIGLLVLWQMRTQPRPLSAPLAAQQLQAMVGLVLAAIGVTIVYIGVALRGPGGQL